MFSLDAMVFDNRFFPLIQYPYINRGCQDSHLTMDFFVTTASKAADDRDREIGIAELSGPFDQSQIAFSMVLAGFPNPLPPLLLDGELPWILRGKLQTQGFAFSYQQYVRSCLSVGVLALAMRSNSYIDFMFDTSKASSFSHRLSEADIVELDEIRRAMLTQLGLACNHVHQAGIGDIEAYLRWSDCCNFCYKLRSLNYGIRLGTLIPTGVKRNIDEPASVPFGGNGHWGVYGSLDAEFEVKEDWKVGFLLRLSKRFARTRLERLPVGRAGDKDVEAAPSDPQIFGVLTGPVTIDPGLTEVFYLYTQWEGIREGLAIRLQYTLINHNTDHWKDKRIDRSIPINLERVNHRSKWASEYVTLSALYDFDKVSTIRCNRPIVRAAWDVPMTLLVGNRFVHSYRISLGLEFNF